MLQRIPIESICENCGDHIFDFYRKRKNCSRSCAASGHMKKIRQSRFGPKTEEEKKKITESWNQFSPEMRHARGLKIWETRRKNALQQ